MIKVLIRIITYKVLTVYCSLNQPNQECYARFLSFLVWDNVGTAESLGSDDSKHSFPLSLFLTDGTEKETTNLTENSIVYTRYLIWSKLSILSLFKFLIFLVRSSSINYHHIRIGKNYKTWSHKYHVQLQQPNLPACDPSQL